MKHTNGKGVRKLINYEDIKRNIAESSVSGNMVKVRWKCPVSEEVIAESSAKIEGDTSLEGSMSQELTRGVLQATKGWFASLASSVLGGQAGNTVRRMGTTLADHLGKKQKYGGEEQQKAAIIRAFEKVQDKFEYAQEYGFYTAKKSATPPPVPPA